MSNHWDLIMLADEEDPYGEAHMPRKQQSLAEQLKEPLKGKIEWVSDDEIEFQVQGSQPQGERKLLWSKKKRVLWWFLAIIAFVWCAVIGIPSLPLVVLLPPIGIAGWTIAAMPLASLICWKQGAKVFVIDDEMPA